MEFWVPNVLANATTSCSSKVDHPVLLMRRCGFVVQYTTGSELVEQAPAPPVYHHSVALPTCIPEQQDSTPRLTRGRGLGSGSSSSRYYTVLAEQRIDYVLFSC